MTTYSHHPRARRRLDIASLLLLLVGAASGVLSHWLVQERGFNVLLIVPSVVAATTGVSNLKKWEAPRD